MDQVGVVPGVGRMLGGRGMVSGDRGDRDRVRSDLMNGGGPVAHPGGHQLATFKQLQTHLRPTGLLTIRLLRSLHPHQRAFQLMFGDIPLDGE